MAQTGGGGRHYLYGAKTPVEPPAKLAGRKGIDLKYNGYIVLAPSPHNSGTNYKWLPGKSPFDGLNARPMLGFPKWFLAAGPATIEHVGTVDEEDADFTGSDKAGITLGKLAEYLDLLPNTPDTTDIRYPEWVNILSGIWHEFDGSAEAEQIARDWCAQWPDYTDESFDSTWPTLDHRGKSQRPITIRKLIKMAEEAKRAQSGAELAEIKNDLSAARDIAQFRELSVRIKNTELDVLDRNMMRAELQKAYKHITGNTLLVGEARNLTAHLNPNTIEIPEWLEPFIYVSGEEIFYERGTSFNLTKKGFDNNYNRMMLTKTERLEGLAVPANTASDAALNRYQIPRVQQRMYLPSEDEFFTFNGIECVNTYSTKQIPKVPNPLTDRDLADQEIILAHFRHITRSQRDADILMSWLAGQVQSNERPNWAVVVQSLEGDGKSIMTAMIGCLFGADNVGVLNSGILKGDFTGWAAGHQLKIIEEIKLHGKERFDVLDKLKEYITNPTISVHAKNKEPVTAVNTAAYLALTNHRDALPNQVGDTRYFQISSPYMTTQSVADFKKENPEYYPNLFAVVHGNPGAVRALFETYKLHPECSPVGRAPQSDEKDYVTAMNKSDARVAIEDLLEESEDPALCITLFDTTLMQEKLEEAGDDVPQGHSIKVAMIQIGFQYLGRFRVDKILHRFWSQTPERFGALGKTSTGKAIRTYLSATSTDDL